MNHCWYGVMCMGAWRDAVRGIDIVVNVTL
jgi:hypothetical protein